jgi:hypothetical protein
MAIAREQWCVFKAGNVLGYSINTSPNDRIDQGAK